MVPWPTNGILMDLREVLLSVWSYAFRVHEKLTVWFRHTGLRPMGR